MNDDLIAKLTDKDDKAACMYAGHIIDESRLSNKWYAFFNDFAALLNHPKSYVRNRTIYILAENVKWDIENRFDLILPDYLLHITDVKPITARQCVKALAQIGKDKPQYIPRILSALQNADLSGYKDSMRPLIEKDISETTETLKHAL